jgi:hypothetical protein
VESEQEMILRTTTSWFFIVFTLLISACSGGGGSSSQAQPTPTPVPAKVFALMDAGDTTVRLEEFAALDSVDGLAFRASWARLEPQAGVYDWSSLDDAFDIVRDQNKLLTLHANISGIGEPDWLIGLGVATYTYASPLGGSSTEPIPWDATFLARYTQFLAAMAAHIQARGDGNLLYAVSDGAPVAEMSLYGCLNNTLTGGTPYSRSDYLTAWTTTVDAHIAAFPSATFPEVKLFISAPVAVICRPDIDGEAFYTELMNHALDNNPQTAIFAADLNANGSTRLNQVATSISARTSIGLQFIWSSSDDPDNRMQGTLSEAVCRGLDQGANYFEFYKDDLSSAVTGIQNAIQLARDGGPC